MCNVIGRRFCSTARRLRSSSSRFAACRRILTPCGAVSVPRQIVWDASSSQLRAAKTLPTKHCDRFLAVCRPKSRSRGLRRNAVKRSIICWPHSADYDRTNSVIVFADADIAPDPYWLARLNRGLDDAHIASGYRWLVPTDDRWATAFTCVANSSVATAQRRLWNLAWGGSLALRRRLLGELEIEKVWDRAVSDDLPLTQAVKARGIRIVGPRDALVQSPASYSWREAITFGRRQYLFLRIHAPFHWAMVAAVTTIPLLGWIAALSLILTNATLAVGVIVVANSLDHLRAYFRRRVSRKLWGTGISRRVAWLDSWGTPAVLAGHALIIWSTLVGRSVTWADRVYWVDRSAEVHQIKQLPGSDASGTLRTQEV